MFDIISHSILLEELAAHDLDRWAACWMKGWLDGLAQRVLAMSSVQLVAGHQGHELGLNLVAEFV